MMFFDHPYTRKIQELSTRLEDRYDFHREAESTIRKMASDPEFLDGVVQYNFSRLEFLQHQWSLYEIPCLWIADTGDFQMKFHIFLPMKDFEPGIAASAIHHHNNYLLSTLGVCGSGYETFIFEKGTQLNPDKGPIELKVRKNFIQSGGTYTLVDSWEPHVVFSPENMSTTLTLWTPDKQRTTDKLRHNPLLKAVKKPLRYMIHAFGMEEQMGIAAAKTYQFYVEKGQFKAVDEEEFFAPSKAAKGEQVDDDYIKNPICFFKGDGISEP